jgi:thiol:disulfide interchange protein DsbD
VKRLLTFSVAAALWLFAHSASAAHTRATLLLSATTAKPGDTILAAVRLQMDPGWHTYWKNPGASGMATTITWQLPPGISAGAIEWPLPEKLPADDLTTYIYHDEAVLLVPLKLSADLKPGPLEIKADVSWLECEKACVPGEANVTAKIEIGPDSKPSTNAALLQTWQKKLPQSAANLSASATWEKAASGDWRPLILEWSTANPVSEPDFFPDASDAFEVQPATEILSIAPDKVRLRKVVKKLEGDWPKEISGVLGQKSGGETHGYAAHRRGFGTGRFQHARAIALANAPLRLHRRIDSKHHALCAAGHRAENSWFRRPVQGSAGARAQTRIDLRGGCPGFVRRACGPRHRRESRRASGRLGHAV